METSTPTTTTYFRETDQKLLRELTILYSECLREAYGIYGGGVDIELISETSERITEEIFPLLFGYTTTVEPNFTLEQTIKFTNFREFLSRFTNILPPAPENEEDILSILLQYSIPPQFEVPFLRNQVWTLLDKNKEILEKYYNYFWWKMAAFTWLFHRKNTGNLKLD